MFLRLTAYGVSLVVLATVWFLGAGSNRVFTIRSPLFGKWSWLVSLGLIAVIVESYLYFGFDNPGTLGLALGLLVIILNLLRYYWNKHKHDKGDEGG